ncbi:MAG: hypothetical protein JWP58_2752 [Hymenobacter sp.]|nr:hypothetical protein [Hymenobacter sp.]
MAPWSGANVPLWHATESSIRLVPCSAGKPRTLAFERRPRYLFFCFAAAPAAFFAVQLLLTRTVYSPQATIGTLAVDGAFACHVLEDAVRPVKVWGQTAIPAGTYQITITYSRRFRQPLPLLLGVPGYEGVRIHPGNDAAATHGCLLVGRYAPERPDWVADSRPTFAGLFARLQAALAGGQRVWLTIR